MIGFLGSRHAICLAFSFQKLFFRFLNQGARSIESLLRMSFRDDNDEW